jgi:RNA polymerase sigma-70 factor (ECF subfamily)
MSGISQPLSGSTSHSLLARVRARDADAWKRLSRLYGPVVYQWTRQAGLQASDALDVGQEVFRTVADRLHDYQGSRAGDAFRGWLWGITQNKLKEFFRRRAAEPAGAGGTAAQEQLAQLAEMPEASSGSSRSAADSALMQRALQLIQAEFEPRTLQAFWQATVDGRSTADVAADLGMSPKAVRQAKYRVLSRLRQELDELL